MELSGKQRRYLRALAHDLRPVVQIGRSGLHAGLSKEVSTALTSHELVKVKVSRECPEDRNDLMAQVAAATDSHLVQALGRTFLLYRAHPEEPQIQLPV